MITLIHGDDIVSSRKYFVGEKEKAKNPLTFDGKTLTITDLTQALEGSMLFTNEKTIFIEDLFTRKQSREKEDILSCVGRNEKDQQIFLWEGGEVTKTTLSTFPNPSIQHFPLPKNLFTFLDCLKPSAREQPIQLFHKTLTTTEVELIFFLLVRRIRLLLALSQPYPQTDGIEEGKRLAPWQQTRLRAQARLFPEETLLAMHGKLFSIDLAQKTGATPLSLTQALDLFLLDL